MIEPLNPVQVEEKLRALVNSIAQAQLALARARDAETECELTYKKACMVALEHPDCPQPNRTTVLGTHLDAFVDKMTWTELQAYKRAKTKTANAVDYTWSLKEQAECVRSLGASVRQAYSMAGQS